LFINIKLIKILRAGTEKDMTMITKNDVLELSRVHGPFCISVFIPTHRAGEETLKGKDALSLKNQLKDVRRKLRRRGMSVNMIGEYIRPASDLVDDSKFWRHQSDGLAIFISEGLFRSYTVPVSFEEFNYLSDELYVKPLMPLFNGDGLFYLLTLKSDEVRFYEATRHSITEIKVNDLIPERLEERVGYDHVQKSLQYRTRPGNKGEHMFHGHRESDAETKNELSRYFRAIDKGLMSILHDNQKPPLLLSCVDYYFPIYQQVSAYQNLFPRHISCITTDRDILLLHEEAWELLQPYFSKNRQYKRAQLLQALGMGKASSDIREILPAAFSGKIDTLFLERRTDVFGTYDPVTFEITIQQTQKSPDISLMNLAAAKVFEHNGTVYLIEKEEMPDDKSEINALFRY
jgi:hypothetical protein